MSKRSKACEISQKVKEIVWNRDKHKCIYCERYVPKTCANAHYIKRSQRWFRHRRKYSYIMSRMPLSGRPWIKYTTIRRLHRKLFKRHLWNKLEQRKIDL